MPDITLARLKEVLQYCPDSGKFYWSVRGKGIRKGGQAGCVTPSGYVTIKIDQKPYSAHRLAWTYVNGKIPANHHIDHINGVRDDNKISNLRCVTVNDNCRNLGMRPHNTSGHTGVCQTSGSSTWLAYISAGGKSVYLGRFRRKSDAIQARREAEKRYGYHQNHGLPQKERSLL